MLTEQDFKLNIMEEIKKEAPIQTKVRSMFELQNRLNLLIHPEWQTQKHWDFQRAIMVELNELMDHYGYKWWKAQTPNLEQCQLEVIDIAHFYISHLQQANYDSSNDVNLFYAVADFSEGILPFEVDKTPENIRSLIDFCVGLAANKEFNSKALGALMTVFDISPHELCDKYILKNTLNIFRTSNGYKEGTYKKIWNGKEDNEVLMDVFEKIHNTNGNIADKLYEELEKEYSKVA
jgi:hypothetical protein